MSHQSQQSQYHQYHQQQQQSERHRRRRRFDDDATHFRGSPLSIIMSKHYNRVKNRNIRRQQQQQQQLEMEERERQQQQILEEQQEQESSSLLLRIKCIRPTTGRLTIGVILFISFSSVLFVTRQSYYVTTIIKESWGTAVTNTTSSSSLRQIKGNDNDIIIHHPRIVTCLVTPHQITTTTTNNNTHYNLHHPPLPTTPPILHNDSYYQIERPPPPSCTPHHPFQNTSHPICNTLHESLPFTISSFLTQSLAFRNRGGGHDVWSFSTTTTETTTTTTTTTTTPVMMARTLRWKRGYTPRESERTRIDAQISSMLQSSPYVIDLYGYCGFTTWNEEAVTTLENAVRRNKTLATRDRLRYGVQATRAFYDLRRVGCSVIREEEEEEEEEVCEARVIHNDIGTSQFLVMGDGTVKLNDFNMAILRYRNITTDDSSSSSSSSSCQIVNGYKCGANGQQINGRSPEECLDLPLDEKIDVFGLSAIYHYLLSDTKPFRTERDVVTGEPLTDDQIRERIVEGVMPELPLKVRNETEDVSVVALRKVWEMSRTWDKSERPGVEELMTVLEWANEIVRRKDLGMDVEGLLLERAWNKE